MGRKLTGEELNDPDFQALLTALKKVSKPVRRKGGKDTAAAAQQLVRGAPTPVSPVDLEP